jgi:hypothetical protein
MAPTAMNATTPPIIPPSETGVILNASVAIGAPLSSGDSYPC